MIRIILLIIGLIFGQATAYGAGKIVAIVGSDIITSRDLQERLLLAKDTLSATHPDIDIRALEPKVLQTLIDDKIFLQEVKKLKLDVTEEDIKFAIQMIEEQNHMPAGGFLKYLKSRNVLESSVIEQIKSQIAWSKIINYVIRPKINITEKEIDEVLAHIVPDHTEVTFQQISVPIADISKQAVDKYMLQFNELRSQIKNCNDAVNIANKKKLEVTRMSVPINQLHQELRNMIMITPRGTASKVIKTDQLLSLIVICQRDYAGVAKKEREEVRETLIQKKLSLQATHYLHELRKKTFIEVRI